MKRILIYTLLLVLGIFAAPQKETMTDPRDGKKYRTVKIGEQTWMAENLDAKAKNSWCYLGKADLCKKYRRLYDWEAAKDACPAGWHLPSKEDFETLVAAVGGESTAGDKLKAASGWVKQKKSDGTEKSGFDARPAGYRFHNGFYSQEGRNVYFWSGTETSADTAYYMSLSYDFGGSFLGAGVKTYGFSVRCVKD